MKIRNGFVSNSSSSSFIVAFDKKPKTIEEVIKVLFDKNQKTYLNPHPYMHRIDPRLNQLEWDVKVVADVIIRDLERDENKRSLTEKQMNEIVGESWSLPDKDLDLFIKVNKGKKFYIFTFSDEDGPFYSSLEHGDLFKNVPHIRISNH